MVGVTCWCQIEMGDARCSGDETRLRERFPEASDRALIESGLGRIFLPKLAIVNVIDNCQYWENDLESLGDVRVRGRRAAI